LLLAIACIVLCLALWRVILRVTTAPAPGAAAVNQPPPALSHTIEVNPADARGIIDALTLAVSGQTILVPPGEFLGPLILKEGVDIVAKDPRQTIVRSDPSSTAEPGIAIVARGIGKAVINGLRVASDDTHPLTTGILVANSSVSLVNLDVSGAVYTGIRIEGDSSPRVTECFVHLNGGSGVGIRDHSAPELIRNQIMQNGLMVNAPRPGIEVGPAAKPLLEGNLISGNGADEPLRKTRVESKKQQGDR
jgi:hypothetical protein